MISFSVLRRWGSFWAALLLGSVLLQAEKDDPEWRTWTSPDGARIEAYLKKVLPDAIVIVRRDGQEFTAPLERFSKEDHAYVTEWLRQQVPSVEDFRALDFTTADVPQSYEIEDVPHVRARGAESPELAAVKMVLDFHQIQYDPGLAERVRVRESKREKIISAQDLTNALRGLSVNMEVIQGPPTRGRPDGDPQTALNAIKKAISLDLPVLVGHRPYLEEETEEVMVVATGYDRRNLEVLDPAGSRQTMRLDLRDLEESLVYGLVIFPEAQPPTTITAATQEQRGAPPTEFLSRVASAIRETPAYDPGGLTEFLKEKGIEATLQDINRSDFRDQLGRTRSFARQGGIPEIEAALDGGKVVVVPQEFEAGEGFALIYGRAEKDFTAVEFFPDRTFRRGTLSPGDLASRWLTRDDRTYRLDLIQIEVSGSPESPPSLQTPPPPPRQDPPGKPPRPPRQ